MSKGNILIVEDDFDVSDMLRIYFSRQGYAVDVAPKGNDALTIARKQLPHLIVLDINLPDMSGYDVYRELRAVSRTQHVPIIFLTEKNERSDKMTSMELGAVDHITKPFDIEELRLRVQNVIKNVGLHKLLHPISSLPTGSLIEDHMRTVMRGRQDWTYIDIKIREFEVFSEVYGWQAGDEVLRFVSLLITQVLEKTGIDGDFLGHPKTDNFMVITHIDDVTPFIEQVTARFAEGIQQHYSFIDRDRGYMLLTSLDMVEERDLMTLSIGSVSTRTHQFSDIREVTEVAAEERRRLSGTDI